MREFLYFGIMHKATGLLMPQSKRNRGYSHWNPAVHTVDHGGGMLNALDTPRLLSTLRKAHGCIRQWACNPNAKGSFSRSYEGEEDYSIDIKEDGRKKEDLEVVAIRLIIED